MRIVLIVTFLFSTASLSAAAEEAGTASVADLAWLTGSWCSESADATAEEHWIEPHGGVILGLNRSVRAAGGVFFEYLRIVEEEGAVVYYASPVGRAATPFTLVESGDRRAVFANPEHDFPQRIIYESTGEELIATIEGEVGGETRSSTWSWKRDACGFLEEDPPPPDD